MPIPSQRDGEKKDKFVQRCMSDDVMKKEYGDTEQRLAVCLSKVNANSLIEQMDLKIIARRKWSDEKNSFI